MNKSRLKSMLNSLSKNSTVMRLSMQQKPIQGTIGITKRALAEFRIERFFPEEDDDETDDD